MTGTPILNRPRELWPLLHAIDPDGIGKNFMGYHRRYCGAEKTRYGWNFDGATNLPELSDNLRSSIMVRRLKADVLTELPAKRRQLIELPQGDVLGDIIVAEKEAFEAIWDLKASAAKFTEISEKRLAVSRAKLPQVIEHVASLLESLDKIIVFAHHGEIVDALDEAFASRAVAVSGTTPPADRQALVDRFQTDPHCNVFIGTILAAGVGLTLTAAQTVIFAEFDWRPGMMEQAEDRARRIGQTGSVLIRYLVFDGSIDAKMAQTFVAKKDVADAALDSAAPTSAEIGPSAALRAAIEAANALPPPVPVLPRMTKQDRIITSTLLRHSAETDPQTV